MGSLTGLPGRAFEGPVRVLLAGTLQPGRLEESYRSAFDHCGCEVRGFDFPAALDGAVPLGKLGRRFQQFVPVEPWVRKANRLLYLAAQTFRPDLVVTFGSYPFRAGTLAQVRAILPTAMAHIWPDTLTNLEDHTIQCLPLFDLVATYSSTSVPLLQRLGAGTVLWVPLAADAELHRPPGSAAPAYSADVSFIGGWRPERERLLERLTPFGLKIWGPDWGKRCRGNPAILKAWQGRGVVSAEFAQVVAGSKVNLNLIDPTNYPAANMRYFEIMVAGGLQVCSPCPEMREGFRAGEHLFYYAEEAELPALLERLLGDAELRNRVAKAGRERVMAEHTYGHRAQAILDACGLGRDSRMNGGCGS